MIRVVQGDITTISCDAIVNAANSTLLGGGGVDGAIHRAGGPVILAECREIRARAGGCPPGDAMLTTAGLLPARFVIHAVGPTWLGGDHGESDLLARCYRRAIELAIANNCKSIAFPNISTGVYRFPKELAARIAVDAVRSAVQGTALERIVFVCFDEENLALYRGLLSESAEVPLAIGDTAECGGAR